MKVRRKLHFTSETRKRTNTVQMKASLISVATNVREFFELQNIKNSIAARPAIVKTIQQMIPHCFTENRLRRMNGVSQNDGMGPDR